MNNRVDSSQEQKSVKPFSPLLFSLVAVGLGVIAGMGAVVFRGLIALVHNLAFEGRISYIYDTYQHSAESPLGWAIIFVPVIGALIVVYLVKNYAPEAKGHGVPEVMGAIYHQRGIIRPTVAAIKSIASAVSIGTGGSVGREGPIIQIGASFGSTLAQIFNIPIWQRITLIATGAAGGIAATFNTPIGGILFAVELMLQEVSVRTLVPVTLGTAMATMVGRWAFGDHPSFIIPASDSSYYSIAHPLSLINYVLLGIMTGYLSYVFIKSIYGFEDLFEKWFPRKPYVRHMVGMLSLGILMYILLRTEGHYYIQGVGYASIQDILSSRSLPIYLLALLLILKLIATSLTLGSGASGGVFSPGLFMGVMLGDLYGEILLKLFPNLHINPVDFGVAAMAGVIGGSTGAALAAIVMVFEMTLDYNVILPISITVALSYGIRKVLSKESLYTLKLARRGLHMPEALGTNFQYLTPAERLMEPKKIQYSGSMPLKEFAEVIRHAHRGACFLVKDEVKTAGVIFRETALEALDQKSKGSLKDIMNTHFVWVEAHTALVDILLKLKEKSAEVALIRSELGSEKASGLITKIDIESAIEDSASLMS